MPREAKITPAVGRTIRAAKKRGEGSRDIVDTVRKRHDIELDRRSIDRWLLANPAAPAKKTAAPPATAPAGDPSEDLDDVQLLTRRAQDIWTRLQGELGPMAEATLSREWRQTRKHLAAVKAAANQAKDQDTTALDWVVEKLERFAAQNGETPTPNGVPEEPRAASGE